MPVDMAERCVHTRHMTTQSTDREQIIMNLERVANEAYNHARRNGYRAADVAKYHEAAEALEDAASNLPFTA